MEAPERNDAARSPELKMDSDRLDIIAFRRLTKETSRVHHFTPRTGIISEFLMVYSKPPISQDSECFFRLFGGHDILFL